MTLARKGHPCSIALDGPKGPFQEIKPGVFELSRLLNAPIYCGGVASDRVWRAEKAWNKAFLPKPFAKVVIVWHGPINAVPRETDPRSPELANTLKAAMRHAQELALKKIAPPPGQC